MRGQGRQNAASFLKEHPDVVQQILQQIQAQAGPEQMVSARLLPSVATAEGAMPVIDEVEVEVEEAEEAASAA